MHLPVIQTLIMTMMYTHLHFLPCLVNEAFPAAQFLVINFKLAGIFLDNTLSPS